MAAPPSLAMRRGQRAFLRLVDEFRLLAFVARRQYGKTTTFARVALKKKMKNRDHTVIFGSAKLSLSRAIVRKEAAILQAAVGVLSAPADAAKGILQVVDAKTDKPPDRLDAADFAELFEAQRLEFRYYHSRASYSRTKVVALRPDTVGETGDLMCDEIGRVANWREVWEAINPIIASNPAFRCTLSTTVPPDDAHYSFEMLVPPPGLVFRPSPNGNLYESEMGITVLRLDAWDAALDGVPLYDIKSGEPISPEESRARDPDKDAWDRNYGLRWIVGGTSACGRAQLDSAQARGIGQAAFILVHSDADFDRALAFLASHIGAGKVGVGVDVATTTKSVSNPTAIAVVEQTGAECSAVLVCAWKTADPAIAQDRLRRIVETIAARKEGGRARRLAIDATNERYFATSLRRAFTPLLPVDLVVGSETMVRPGYEPMSAKQLLGSQLVAELEDNHLTLPPERYLRDDWRLVRKERGALVCEPDPDGKHGDTFDASKLALHALIRGVGPAAAAPAQVGSFGRPAERVSRLRPNPNRDRPVQRLAI